MMLASSTKSNRLTHGPCDLGDYVDLVSVDSAVAGNVGLCDERIAVELLESSRAGFLF